MSTQKFSVTWKSRTSYQIHFTLIPVFFYIIFYNIKLYFSLSRNKQLFCLHCVVDICFVTLQNLQKMSELKLVVKPRIEFNPKLSPIQAIKASLNKIVINFPLILILIPSIAKLFSCLMTCPYTNSSLYSCTSLE